MVGGGKTSLGGEYVGGEIVRWWRDRSLVASSLVASLPGGEVTGNRKVNSLGSNLYCFLPTRASCSRTADFC